MDDNKYPEQQAPEKNTDNAFVQVGEDGSPVIPDKTNDDSATDKTGAKDNPTTLADR